MSRELSLVALSALAEINPKTPLPHATECSFVGMEDVSESGMLFLNRRASSSKAAGYTAFKDGDVLFAKITPCMENGKGALAQGLHGGFGFGSTEFHVLRARNSAVPRFLAQWCQTKALRLSAEAMMTGSAGQRRVPTDFFDRYLVPYFPPAVQECIADILDSVDESIRAIERVIVKLAQVRRGLKSDATVPRAAWKAVNLSELLLSKPKAGYSPKEVDGYTGIGMLGLGCLTPEGFEPRQIKSAPVGDARLRQAYLRDGDLLMSRSNTRELVGLTGRFRDIGIPCIYPDLMMRLVPNNDVLPDYLELMLGSPQIRRQIQASAVGTSGSMVKVNSKAVLGLAMRLPPLSEQRQILHALSVIDAPLRAARQERSQLSALKQGLMKDLLTGQVRVKPEEGAEP